MNISDLKNNPNLKHIERRKLELIQNLAAQAADKKQEEILPFFLAVNAKAAELGISFSSEEIELILETLKPKMSPSDIHKIEMIKNFSKMMSGKSK